MNPDDHGNDSSDTPTRPQSTQELRTGKPNRHGFHDLPRTPLQFVLDGVKSASNLGNIFRVADALLAEKIWICHSQVNLKGYKFRKAAKSMENWVPFEEAPDTSRVLRSLKAQGYLIIGVELTTKSVHLNLVTPGPKMVVLVGSESKGISTGALELCDQVVVLPQLGLGNSVNVGTALAVVAYSLFEGQQRLTKAGKH